VLGGAAVLGLASPETMAGGPARPQGDDRQRAIMSP
jgi:hypothetical protein